MRSTLPRFNAQRMVMDYVRDYYLPAQEHRKALAKNNGRAAYWLAEWKSVSLPTGRTCRQGVCFQKA